MKRIAILLTLAVLLLSLTGVVLANGSASIDWHVIGGGGDRLEAGDYTLDCTVGQAVVGTARNDPYELCAGYWCGAAVEHSIYLPLVLRAA
jgi:hypothetical protein